MKTLVIEKNIPIPTRYIAGSAMDAMRKAFNKMRIGDSFIFEGNKHPYIAARDAGIRIKTQKISGQGYRIWKIGNVTTKKTS